MLRSDRCLASASPAFQFEPFWLYLDQNAERTAPLERTLNTFGFHAFGLWNARTWDYDVSLVGADRETRGLPQRAWAAHAEVGYVACSVEAPGCGVA